MRNVKSRATRYFPRVHNNLFLSGSRVSLAFYVFTLHIDGRLL